MPSNIFVRYLSMPHTVEAVVLPNADGTFDIYINSAICPDKQAAALDHELNHIKLNHLYDENPVIINEREAG